MSKDDDGGDPESHRPQPLNALVAKYGNSVRRFIRSRWRGHPPQNHEDLAQEVYLKLLRYPPGRPPRNPEAYLFKVAASVMSDFAKKNARERLILDFEDTGTSADATADASVDQEQHTAIEQELALLQKILPPLHLAALVLHKRDGYSQAEIAKVIGKSTETVRKYISEAIARWTVERNHIGTRRSVK